MYGYFQYTNEVRKRARARERNADIQRAIRREARRVMRKRAQRMRAYA